MKKLLLLSMYLLSILFVSIGCDDNDEVDATPPPTAPSQNIVEIAQASGFSSLAAALTKADLVETLQSSGDFTVFAPTNKAFDDLLAAIGQSSIDDVPADVLREVLLYHVLGARVFSTQVSAGDVETLQGSSFNITTNDGIQVNGANVIGPFDVEASNGVIHTIDAVIVPPSIAQFVNTVLEPAYFNENFTTLIAAAAKAGVVGALLETPNLTIFGPTNDAFEAAGIDPEQVDAETLAAVLTYHVVGAKVMSSEIPSEATTLNGAKIFFSLTDNGAYINGETMITAVDIESGSGVIHVLDNVLMPPSGNIVEKAIELSQDGEFTSLIAALQRTANEGTAEQNLIAALSGDGPFTVFAPTNAAFQALLDSNSEWSSLGDIPLETLIQVLLYHVVGARAYDKDLPAALAGSDQLMTLQGGYLTFDLSSLMINGDTKIVGTNAHASNGVIHVIDKVLIP
ncbi:fasciclin domain-containing protein [Puteibacter caeruleilacunae]|nr:fasciclin domain-containing protein [Puteibacter caeruleilacunae]